jgi:hypothetical protein
MGKTLNCITAVGIPGLFVGFLIAWSYYVMMFHVFLNYYKNLFRNLPLLISYFETFGSQYPTPVSLQ